MMDSTLGSLQLTSSTPEETPKTIKEENRSFLDIIKSYWNAPPEK